MRQVKQINNSPEKELLDMLSIENQDEFIKDETNIEKFNSIKKFINYVQVHMLLEINISFFLLKIVVLNGDILQRLKS